MPSVLVNVLRALNGTNNRNNSQCDKAFIKAALIGFCTIKAIVNRTPIHRDLLLFIKGTFVFIHMQLLKSKFVNVISELFVHRISGLDDDDGTRYLSFNLSVEVACEEIRQKNYSTR